MYQHLEQGLVTNALACCDLTRLRYVGLGQSQRYLNAGSPVQSAGLAVGYTLCYFADKYRWVRLDETVYSLSFVPFEPRWVDGVWVAAAAILVSFLATIYPARNATRIVPAEILRYE